MLTGAKRSGFLPVIHTDKAESSASTSAGGGSRRSRMNSSAGGNSNHRVAGVIPGNNSINSNRIRNSRGSFRWGRRWFIFRFFQRLRTGAFPFRYCLLLFLLAACVITQLVVFMKISRNTGAYLASSSLLKKSTYNSSTDAQASSHLSAASIRVLLEEYDSASKALPYVGNEEYMQKLQPLSRGWYNSLAVFPFSSDQAMHGRLGVNSNGDPQWVPAEMPPSIDAVAVNKTEELKTGGGFYLKLSDALPLDRLPPDNRDPMCLSVNYDYKSLSDSVDVSIIMTFYNEPLSTLLRSIHSVLNYTPPPLIREFILVDDSSNSTSLLPGNELDSYLPLLPKVKLLRMEERSGIVPARMHGIRAAAAPVVVILDSHIEVNFGWLEPQLKRIHESPKSFVFPQTLSISSTDFHMHKDAGIGCSVSFDWNVQEKSQVAGFWGSTDVIPSPMHGGGLVAFRKDTFFDLGGYDEGMTMWGAENVELSFRVWMCGGRLECSPCASVYHIFRSGGSGYPLPAGSVWKNRIRTAKLWMGEYLPLAAAFNSFHLSHPEPELPDMTKMIELKKRLKCKDIKWFMNTIDKDHEYKEINKSIKGIGEIKNNYFSSLCLDTLGEIDINSSIGLFNCHGQLGNQGFILDAETNQLRLMSIGTKTRSRLCMRPPNTIYKCISNNNNNNNNSNNNNNNKSYMYFNYINKQIKWTQEGEYYNHCLSIQGDDKKEVTFVPCIENNKRQEWLWYNYSSFSSFYLPIQLNNKYKYIKYIEEKKKEKKNIFIYINKKYNSFCIDSLQERYNSSPFSVYWCHGGLGTQGFIYIKEKGLLVAHARGTRDKSYLCLFPPSNLYLCINKQKKRGKIFINKKGQIQYIYKKKGEKKEERKEGEEGEEGEEEEEGGEEEEGEEEESAVAAAEQQEDEQQQQQQQEEEQQQQQEEEQQQQQEEEEEEEQKEPLCLTLIDSPETPVTKRTTLFMPCKEDDDAQIWISQTPKP